LSLPLTLPPLGAVFFHHYEDPPPPPKAPDLKTLESGMDSEGSVHDTSSGTRGSEGALS
jgi:hypothetical protein